MGLFDGIVGAVAGPLVSGLFGYMGQQEVNDTNQDIANNNSAFNAEEAQKARIFNAGQAEENRNFNASQAAEQRQWAERLSGSAYQRAVADMQAAGLNPMLAYAQGGASTPSGSSATGSAASGPAAQAAPNAVIGNKNLAGAQSAQMAADVAQRLANVDKTNAETKNVEASTDNVRTLTESERMRQPGHMLSGERAQAEVRKLKEEIGKILEDQKVSNQTATRINAEINNIIKTGKNIDETWNLIRAQIGREASQEQLNRVETRVRALFEKGEGAARSNLFEMFNVGLGHSASAVKNGVEWLRDRNQAGQ